MAMTLSGMDNAIAIHHVNTRQSTRLQSAQKMMDGDQFTEASSFFATPAKPKQPFLLTSPQ